MAAGIVGFPAKSRRFFTFLTTIREWNANDSYIACFKTPGAAAVFRKKRAPKGSFCGFWRETLQLCCAYRAAFFFHRPKENTMTDISMPALQEISSEPNRAMG